jgi:hypothetical protein
MQERENHCINSNDTSISRTKQQEAAIPQSKVSAFSSGKFVGILKKEQFQTFTGVFQDYCA